MEPIDVSKLNNDIVTFFTEKGAIDDKNWISYHDLPLDCDPKVKLLLVNEYVKQGFIVVEGEQMYFKLKKFKNTKSKVYLIYSLFLILPLILGILLIMY